MGARLHPFSVVSRVGVLAVLAGTSCGGTSPESPLGAALRLTATNGKPLQYVPGPLVDEAGAVGPAVRAISAAFRVAPGTAGRSLNGTAEHTAATVLVGLDGDVGHYIVPVGGTDLDNPPDVTFGAQASFAPTLPLGSAVLRARAVSVDGALGLSTAQALSVEEAGDTGTLVITLTWDTEADLDLHVVTPPTKADGKPVELWSGNRSTLLPRSALEGGAYTDAELATAGTLTFDSNAQCTIDGLRKEVASWQVPPPAGHYVVRVDTFSMCGQAAARWNLTATLDGAPIGTYAGVSTDSDTRYPHRAGGGLQIFEFDL